LEPRAREQTATAAGNLIGSPDFEKAFHINIDESVLEGFLRFGQYYFGRMCKRAKKRVERSELWSEEPERKSRISDEGVDET
jgi:hypothetical protein